MFTCSGFGGITSTRTVGVFGILELALTATWPLPKLGQEKHAARLCLSIFPELLGTLLSLYPFHAVNLALADSPGNCLM